LALASTISFKRAVPVRRAQGALLEVDDVSIRFGGVRALDGVSMEVREGELIGIMGPNGSGKTTLLNNISGFLSPNSGDIRFQGRSILKMPAHERAALGLGRTFQNVGLVKQETVFDNFLISQHLVCKYGSLEGLARTGGVLAEERRLRQRAHAAISMLGLEDIAGTQVRALPHGRAKLVELGCALVTGPELLLLDEPAAGVSPQEADALGETLKAIAKHFGVTILMIEHHVPLMLSTCDYIYVLNFGRMLTHGEPEEVARHPDVIAAYLGSAGREPSLAPA
jgi:branched-chain amino acid transport system ATP-binding protein